MAYFLALDVGGTKTDYVLADATTELARVRTGTIKRLRVDANTAASRLDHALGELTLRSGIPMSSIFCTCVGTAGESVPIVADWLRHAVGTRVSGDLILLGDVEIALDAAFQGNPGVLAMAGTGSNVAGRMPNGSLTTAGGWGPALADQGSGHKIGLACLRAAFLARDEGRATLLLDEVLDFWKLPSLDHLVEYANSDPMPDFSRLTELILHCATEGDEVAASVLEREGQDLAYLVCLVIRRIQTAVSSSKPNTQVSLPSLAFTGSILEKVPPVRRALIAAVQQEFPIIQTLDGVVDPIAGAIWRARSLAQKR